MEYHNALKHFLSTALVFIYLQETFTAEVTVVRKVTGDLFNHEDCFTAGGEVDGEGCRCPDDLSTLVLDDSAYCSDTNDVFSSVDGMFLLHRPQLHIIHRLSLHNYMYLHLVSIFVLQCGVDVIYFYTTALSDLFF